MVREVASYRGGVTIEFEKDEGAKKGSYFVYYPFIISQCRVIKQRSSFQLHPPIYLYYQPPEASHLMILDEAAV